MSKRDYYDVLGVGKNASADELKKAFRRAAVEHHPDKGGDETKFKEINEAYEVLKDPSKRQRYDQFGHAGVGSSAASDGNPFGGFGGAGGQNVNFDFGDLGDIFSSFFGGGSRQQQRAGKRRGQDINTGVEITFEQAVFGTEIQARYGHEVECEHCKGSTVEPGHEMKPCDECKGSGQVEQHIRTVFGNIRQAAVCPTCRGEGKIPEKVCSRCRGKGTEFKNQELTIKIPAGIDDGMTMRLSGKGNAIARGESGDLFVDIRVKPHKHFTREGDIILSEEHVGIVDATLGAEIDVETVDGPVRMKVPPGTQSGTDFKLSSHGVPHIKSQTRGPHIVTLFVDTPQKLSRHQKQLLEDLKNSGL